jgi:hypothetical protein
MNVTPFVRIRDNKAGDTQYMEAGQPTPHPYPFYMGTGFILLSPNMPTTPRLACCVGTIYSVFFENSPILIIKICKTLFITSCPLEWRGTLRMKIQTASMSGLQLLWTAGEPWRWQPSTEKRARELLQSGSPQCSTYSSNYRIKYSIIVVLCL